jgi:hypothetical protein
MSLLSVNRIYKKDLGQYGGTFYILKFDRARLAAHYLHCFMVVKDGQEIPTKTTDLKPGDKIWVDMWAFAGDGSFSLDIDSPVR